jgi:hypothetical protein
MTLPSPGLATKLDHRIIAARKKDVNVTDKMELTASPIPDLRVLAQLPF